MLGLRAATYYRILRDGLVKRLPTCSRLVFLFPEGINYQLPIEIERML